MTSDRPALLIVTTRNETLGFLLPYADHLRARGWRVEAAANTDTLTSAVESHFDRVWDVPWERRLGDRRNVWSAPRRFRAVVRATRPDIVHTHTPIASFLSRATLGTTRRPARPAVVYTAHGFHFHPGGNRLGNAVFATAEWLAGRVTDRLVVINEDDFTAARRLHLVRRDRLRLFPGIGLDLGWYHPTPALHDAAAAVRDDLGLPADSVLFSMLAEMNPGKNHVAAIRALARTCDERFHLCLGGTGGWPPELDSEARSLGVLDRVHVLGWLEDPRALMLASAATVLPSRREGLSRAVLESVALGVPVIGSDIRGIAEVVGDDGGVLVDPDDVDAIAAAMTRCADPLRRPSMTAAGARMSRYSLDTLLDLHESMYRELLGHR